MYSYKQLTTNLFNNISPLFKRVRTCIFNIFKELLLNEYKSTPYFKTNKYIFHLFLQHANL